MGPNPEDNFIENSTTGKRIGLRVEKGTFVFDVEFKDGEGHDHVGLRGLGQRVAMLPRDPRLRMTAAKGSEIQNYDRIPRGRAGFQEVGVN